MKKLKMYSSKSLQLPRVVQCGKACDETGNGLLIQMKKLGADRTV